MQSSLTNRGSAACWRYFITSKSLESAGPEFGGRDTDIVMKMNESASGSPLEEYDFERRFDEREALEWMQENW